MNSKINEKNRDNPWSTENNCLSPRDGHKSRTLRRRRHDLYGAPAIVTRTPEQRSTQTCNAPSAKPCSPRNGRISGGFPRAPALTSSLKNSWASLDHLPPVSQTNTTRGRADPGRQRVLDTGILWFASPGPMQLRHDQHTVFVEHHPHGRH